MRYTGKMADAASARYVYYCCPYAAAGARSNRELASCAHGEYDTTTAGTPRPGLPYAASGLYAQCSLTAVAGADIVDGDNFTIDNGERSATFEFDLGGGVTAGRVAVVVTALMTAVQVAAAIAQAITASTPWLCYPLLTGPADFQIDLINQIPGARGLAGTNVEAVTAAAFALTDFGGTIELLAQRWGKNYAYNSARSTAAVENPHVLA